MSYPTRPLRSESDTEQERNNLLEARRVCLEQLESIEAAIAGLDVPAMTREERLAKLQRNRIERPRWSGLKAELGSFWDIAREPVFKEPIDLDDVLGDIRGRNHIR